MEFIIQDNYCGKFMKIIVDFRFLYFIANLGCKPRISEYSVL